MPLPCPPCGRSFKSKEALQQHLRDSPAHVSSFKCETCNKSFGSGSALQQHRRDAHMPSLECEICNKSFGSENALQQHLQDSPAHTSSFECETCRKSFVNEGALQQHTRDSPVHAFKCNTCNRSFGDKAALQQHLQNSAAHLRHTGQSETRTSFMFPDLHPRVVEAVSGEINTIWLNKRNTDYISNVHETHVMGRFKCSTTGCSTSTWSSKKVAIVIGGYSRNGYTAVVFNQRCSACDSLGIMTLDEESYVERVAYRLKVWAGVRVERPPFQGGRGPPHMSELCEGCRQGHCQKGPASAGQLMLVYDR